MAWLVAMDGSIAGRRFPLDATFLVGRGPYNHVVLDDVRISRQHAKISPEAAGHVVYDLSSANGTYVNEALVTKQKLSSGDVVRFGPFRFRFEPDPDTDLTAPKPKRNRRPEELTRRGFEVPTRIVGALDASLSLAARPGLTEMEEADRKLRTLYGFVEAISTTLDEADLGERIVAQLAEVFPYAQIAALYLPDPATSRMDPHRVFDRSGEGRAVLGPLAEDLMEQVVRKGLATLSAPLSMQPDTVDVSSASQMHAPLLVRQQTLGVLNVRSSSGRTFSQADLDLLRALAGHAAVTLHSAKMHVESLKRERLAQDMALAQQIQKSFLPLELPRTQHVRFFVDYEPAYSVGGDFYDVFWVDAVRIGIVVGDVSGKGVSAALLMARVSSDLRAAMLRDGDPASALAEVNRSLFARKQPDIFVTAIGLTVDVSTGVISYASAGHLPPFVVSSAGESRPLEDGSSTALGIFDETTYANVTYTLERKSSLVLYTDGILEATDEAGHQFGFARLRGALERKPLSTEPLADNLLAALRGFVGRAPQYDDITLLVVEWEGG